MTLKTSVKSTKNSVTGSMSRWARRIWENDPKASVKPPKNSVTGSMSRWGGSIWQNDPQNDPENGRKAAQK